MCSDTFLIFEYMRMDQYVLPFKQVFEYTQANNSCTPVRIQ